MIQEEIVYSLGAESSLDRTTPKNSVSIYDFDTQCDQRVFHPRENCLRLSAVVSDLQDCYPWALTFTFNAEVMKSKSPFTQWEIFKDTFVKWKILFIKRMNALCNTRYIISYEIYPELTKSGIIHAHALLYYNSNYANIRTIMAKTWVDKAKQYGVRLSSMKKKDPSGAYNYAFDKCNNVQSWRKYITKEHPEYADNPAIIIRPREIDIEYLEGEI